MGAMHGLGERVNRARGALFPALVVLVVVVAAWPAIAQPGLLNTRGGGDSPFLLQRLHQLVIALEGGHFPVRWMPDANYGYGYPFYNYYAPLSIYIAAASRFLGFSFVRSIHLAQLAGFLAAGLGTYYLARRWFGSDWAGLLAAVAYTVAPFHLVNVYVRGDSLAEFWAMAFYPLVLLAADGLLSTIEHRDPWSVVGGAAAVFAVAYAALILSHNISALIFSPFLLLYLVLRLWPRRDTTATNLDTAAAPLPRYYSVALIVAALALALAMAAWFFVPALAERDLAQLGPVTEGYFRFSNHFRGLDLVQLSPIFDYNPDGGVAFRLGLAQAALSAAGAVALLVAWRRRRPGEAPSTTQVIFLLAAAAIAVIMITPLSRLLWEHLPLLAFTQFPWRFLSVVGFFGALLTGALALIPRSGVGRALLVMFCSLALAATSLLGLRVDHLILTDDDITPERLAQYEWFTGNIGSTVSAEYLPPDAAPRPYTSAWLNAGVRDNATALRGQLDSATLASRTATTQTWVLEVGNEGATVLLPTLYWPGWTAAIDGRQAVLSVQTGSGLMRLDVPGGRHTVTLMLGRTPVRRAAEWVSLVAIPVAFALLLAGLWVRRDRVRREGSLIVIGIAAAVIILLALGAVWRDENVTLPDTDLTWDFAQMGYLHHSLDGVAFDDGTRLAAYDYSGDEAAAGETFTVSLSLSPGTAETATLALVTPASARPTPRDMAEPPELVAQTQPVSESVLFTLAVPQDAPDGLYVPRLTLDEAHPLTPSGQTRGDLFMRPLRITGAIIDGPSADHAETDTETFAGDVQAVALSLRDPLTLEGHFAWTTDRPIGARYQVSWRLQDGDGAVLSALDTQPGYGFQPTSGWPAGQPVYDRLALRLPEELTGPAPHALVIILYDPTTGEELLRRKVGELVVEGGELAVRSHEPVFSPPVDIIPLDVTFSEGEQAQLALRGYRIDQSGNGLYLSLVWEGLADINTDIRRFVHLIDEATGAIVAQVDGHPAAGAYPTGQWLPGEIVSDSVTFDLVDVPPGTYRLATGFYRPVDGLPRLTAVGPEGALPDGRTFLPDLITIQP